MNLIERIRLERAVQTYSWWLDLRGAPGRDGAGSVGSCGPIWSRLRRTPVRARLSTGSAAFAPWPARPFQSSARDHAGAAACRLLSRQSW